MIASVSTKFFGNFVYRVRSGPARAMSRKGELFSDQIYVRANPEPERGHLLKRAEDRHADRP